MSVYTKRGDRGTTALYSPKIKKRISKDSQIFATIGSIDGLNSYLGIVICKSEDQKLQVFLKDIQRDLFTVNSILAGAKLRFGKAKTTKLEKKIDEFEKVLPPLKNFILPGGTAVASALMYARTLVRDAEREMVLLSSEQKVKPSILMYMNRLSDLFFILARFSNFSSSVAEEIWKQS